MGDSPAQRVERARHHAGAGRLVAQGRRRGRSGSRRRALVSHAVDSFVNSGSPQRGEPDIVNELKLGDSLSTVDGDTGCQHKQQRQDRQHGPPSEEFDDGAGQQTADDLSAYEEELALAPGRRHFVGGIRAHQQHRALVVAECPGDGDAQQCHRDERSVLT